MANNKEKLNKLIKVSPLLLAGIILIGLAIQFIVELGADYTTITYMIGVILLSIGLSILDNEVNGEIIYGTESKT
jgi:predicted tellurium resistance membrane protein TerC